MNKFKNFTDIDFQILNFIKKNDPIHIDKILKKFSNKKYSTNYRLDILSSRKVGDIGYIKMNYKDKDESNIYSLGVPTGTLSITKKGLKLLSDYQNDSKGKRIKTFKTSFLYPIISATITAIIVSYLTNLFLKRP